MMMQVQVQVSPKMCLNVQNKKIYFFTKNISNGYCVFEKLVF